jgi:hypothetical protein
LSFYNTFEEKCYLSSYARYIPDLRIRAFNPNGEPNLWFCDYILDKYSCHPSLMEQWSRELSLGNFDAYCGLLVLCCSRLRELSLSHRFIEGNIFIRTAFELSATCPARLGPRNRMLPERAENFHGGFLGNIEGFTSSIDMPWNPEGHSIRINFLEHCSMRFGSFLIYRSSTFGSILKALTPRGYLQLSRP